ncbi:uncharacterized protein LOC105767450 isoform X2 [Gossypium raimondii]|uniref:K-box domain-containing protein n=1 Tax=Gossypium raimondii TaxID=29730 RepID=A0A0D2U2S7_GOSRA|nr:uncharacterized protein LOC105767450 isoform X2 [Gossypium raimondii]KJB62261.1 hypothetical protein B456_009G408900 [Gossypium raimondii]
MLKRSVKEGRSLTRSFLVSVTQYLFSWMIDFYFAGVIVFYKLAVVEGMSMRALIAYRFIFATACITPLVFIFERQRMGGDLNELNINELQALEAKMDSSFLAIRERKPPLKRLLTMFLGYHVIKTRTDTHKKKVRNLEERHANLVMDLDQMQWVAWKRLLAFENMGAFLLSVGTKASWWS